MARDWDSGALRDQMFLILGRMGPDDAKRFGKVLGEDALNSFFRKAFELGWKAGQERLDDIRKENPSRHDIEVKSLEARVKELETLLDGATKELRT